MNTTGNHSAGLTWIHLLLLILAAALLALLIPDFLKVRSAAKSNIYPAVNTETETSKAAMPERIPPLN